MNEVAKIEGRAVAQHDPKAMYQMAQLIAQGGLFGSKDPAAVFTLMLVAQAEGKHPGRVMQDYHVISGKPAKKADAMLADFLASGGRVEWHALTDTLADATFSHPAGGAVRITWDDKRIAAAGLGSNPMHKKYPRQMKRARAVSEGVRTVYPGATGGLYVPEEVADFGDERPAPRPANGGATAMLADAVADDPTPAPVEEATAFEALSDAGESAAPASGGFDLGEPSHTVLAHSLDLQYRATATAADLETAWRDTAADRKRVIMADGTYKHVFASILQREKDRLVGDGMAVLGITSDGRAA